MSKTIYQIRRRDDGAVLAQNCAVADGFLTRLVGLLNHDKLEPGAGLLIAPCNQVHTFFMRFPIDVVFLNADNAVVAVKEMPAWRISALHFRAKKVLELPLGTCRTLNLCAGQNLELTCSS